MLIRVFFSYIKDFMDHNIDHNIFSSFSNKESFIHKPFLSCKEHAKVHVHTRAYLRRIRGLVIESKDKQSCKRIQFVTKL